MDETRLDQMLAEDAGEQQRWEAEQSDGTHILYPKILNDWACFITFGEQMDVDLAAGKLKESEHSV